MLSTVMKPSRSLVLGAAVLTLGLGLGSCNTYLDANPSSTLVEPSSPAHIRALLTRAYPLSSPTYIQELSSDNILDDGVRNPNSTQFVESVVYWRPALNSDSEYDAVYNIWETHYNAIAHANEALATIARLGTDDPELQGLRGEALVARAWAHFCLANLFCQAYSPTESTRDPGIPYIAAVVPTVRPDYPRGTLADTYAQIERDLQEGIPLIERHLSYAEEYKPYHFSAAAAHAFAARFYLYYQKWSEALSHANQVLGTRPESVLRDWEAFSRIPRTDQSYALAYFDGKNPANLLTQTTYSVLPWITTNGVVYFHTRFAQAQELTRTETLYTRNIWGNGDRYYFQPFIYTEVNTNKTVQPKFPNFPSNSNVTWLVPLTTDETLLVRAEAKIHLGADQWDSAVADLNLWTSRYLNTGASGQTLPRSFSRAAIVSFYQGLDIDSREEASPRKPLSPSFAIATDEENALLQHLLQCRRLLTLHEGLRWQDIKRYGIPVYRRQNVGGRYVVQAELTAHDARHAIQLPDLAAQGSIKPNEY